MIDISKLAAETFVVPGRSCGTCTMCCKLFDIPEIPTTSGNWCRHCAPGKGCRIYDARPETCRNFHCGWMVSPGLGPEWKPDRAKLIVQLHAAGDGTFRLTAYVDEGFPTAWRRPDIYAKLKEIATSGSPANPTGTKVVVRVKIGRRHIIILPDRDEDVGALADDEDVNVTARGGLINVEKVKR